jgi:acyl carrier protein
LQNSLALTWKGNFGASFIDDLAQTLDTVRLVMAFEEAFNISSRQDAEKI